MINDSNRHTSRRRTRRAAGKPPQARLQQSLRAGQPGRGARDHRGEGLTRHRPITDERRQPGTHAEGELCRQEEQRRAEQRRGARRHRNHVRQGEDQQQGRQRPVLEGEQQVGHRHPLALAVRRVSTSSCDSDLDALGIRQEVPTVGPTSSSEQPWRARNHSSREPATPSRDADGQHRERDHERAGLEQMFAMPTTTSSMIALMNRERCCFARPRHAQRRRSSRGTR